MATITATEMRQMTEDQILLKVAELREERFRLRFRSATETIENPMRFRIIRREIARALTILGEKRRKA